MLPIITGPTGSGKSSLAESFAKRCGYGIINADVFQFYKEIPIISNQPENISVPAFFMADRSIQDPLNAGDYGRLVEPHLNSKNILVGTGLYLGAALWGLDPERKKGTPFQKPPRVDYRMIVLDPERANLYAAIDARVDQMIERGAIDEVKHIKELRDQNQISKIHPILKTIGIRQMISHLDGAITYDEALRLWKRDTRRLAKRQWTWLRGFSPPSERVKWMSFESLEMLKGYTDEIAKHLKLAA